MRWEYLFTVLRSDGCYLMSGNRMAHDGETIRWEEAEWASVNDLGADGWELVAVGEWESRQAQAVFKRPLPS